MRNLAQNEILALSALMSMESYGLAVAKASINAMSDDQLRSMSESAIMASEARIRSMQQIIHDNTNIR